MRPANKRHRFLIGFRKGKKRISNIVHYTSKEIRLRDERRHRNTTQFCSCEMCGNPRRQSKGKEKFTLQERKNFIEAV